MIFRNYSLRKRNTFGLDYHADTFITIGSENEAKKLFQNRIQISQPHLIIGGGSNLLFTEDFKGTILSPEIMGISVEEKKSDTVTVSAGAGVIWDEFAEWCAENGFAGTENLSFIPGNCGAVPVQNIGAYGVEAADIIDRVRAVSVEDGSIMEFTKDECRFGYRTSIFKNQLRGKYLISRVYFTLSLRPEFSLSYGSLRQEVELMGSVSIRNVRNAVIKIRRSKLPDPQETGNAGSFFKNPVVDREKAEKLLAEFKGMPVYDDPSGGKKLAAGWLIEKCGWKGKISGRAAVHDQQSLVIINPGDATGKEIYFLSEEIKKSVMERFGVGLEREVEIIGSI